MSYKIDTLPAITAADLFRMGPGDVRDILFVLLIETATLATVQMEHSPVEQSSQYGGFYDRQHITLSVALTPREQTWDAARAVMLSIQVHIAGLALSSIEVREVYNNHVRYSFMQPPLVSVAGTEIRGYGQYIAYRALS